jgi:hypothetical protein
VDEFSVAERSAKGIADVNPLATAADVSRCFSLAQGLLLTLADDAGYAAGSPQKLADYSILPNFLIVGGPDPAI